VSDGPSLEQLVAARNVVHRDCRNCAHFRAHEELGYGWCDAHDQFVKLYHPPGGFWSQCQFKALARERTPTPTTG
jgi:hypothetical protein